MFKIVSINIKTGICLLTYAWDIADKSESIFVWGGDWNYPFNIFIILFRSSLYYDKYKYLMV